jgi:hypothetical protein
LLGDIETAHEQVGDLASTVPQLKSALEDTEEAETDADAETAEA